MKRNFLLTLILKRNELTDEKIYDYLCFIARMIMGLKFSIKSNLDRQIWNCFIELLNGGNFDVDNLDYIVRDTHKSSISNIAIDVERLLNSLCFISKTHKLI